VLEERYGNLLEMYERATGDNPLEVPMLIYPAAHYSMGGLWVDYELMSTVPGLFVIGEANFSDHGANRLGASALLQGLADGYFIAPLTVSAYVAARAHAPLPPDAPCVRSALAAVAERTERLLSIRGRTSASDYHARLGELLWSGCGLSRNASALQHTLARVRELRAEFWQDVAVPDGANELNQELERAGRVADFLLLGELMCHDALARNESAGCHFREEHQTPPGEARRDDDNFAHVAAWVCSGGDAAPRLMREPLTFRHSPLTERDYR
jgi:succinate dehydrogenase / fumarate reductase flavoprotein subunit